MKTMIYNEKITLSRPYATLSFRNPGTDRAYREGLYYSGHGIVRIYAEDLLVQLDFCYGGREYIRTIHDRYYTDRGLAVIAGRFQRETIEKINSEVVHRGKLNLSHNPNKE